MTEISSYINEGAIENMVEIVHMKIEENDERNFNDWMNSMFMYNTDSEEL